MQIKRIADCKSGDSGDESIDGAVRQSELEAVGAHDFGESSLDAEGDDHHVTDPDDS